MGQGTWRNKRLASTATSTICKLKIGAPDKVIVC